MRECGKALALLRFINIKQSNCLAMAIHFLKKDLPSGHPHKWAP